MMEWLRVVAAMPTPRIAPVFSLWLLVPLLVLAVGASVYLYQEQKRVAAAGAVTAMMVVRALLLVLLLVLFLQPALTWTYQRKSAGTLWLVLDNSPSMTATDPQASDAERLHWAEALGYLPARLRPVKPDRLRAEVVALAGNFAALESPGTGPGVRGDEAGERAAVAAFGAQLSAWRDKAAELQGRVKGAASAMNGLAGGRGSVATAALERAAQRVGNDAAAARNAATFKDAIGMVGWGSVAPDLEQAAQALSEASVASDRAFLGVHGSDGEVMAALARVKDTSRADLAYSFLTNPDMPGGKTLADLAKEYHMRLGNFAATAQGLGSVDSESVAPALKSGLSTSGEQATNLEGALQMAAGQIATDEAASVIVVTDGRSNTAGDPTAPAQSLAGRNVHVYGLLTGSHEVAPDAAVEQVEAPDWVFQGDTVRARATIRLDGMQGRTAVVELSRGGVVMERRTLTAGTNQYRGVVDFDDKPADAARAMEYEVHVQEQPGEVNTQNNVWPFRVSVKKDKLYALIIEDRPRWEYRYLATKWARDPLIKVQTVLLEPAFIFGVAPPEPVRASPQNPRDEAQLLPETAEQWQAFDLIVLGDVGPDVLTNTAQQYIARAVRDKGATLITIAGARAMPGQYVNTPLAELLPVTLEPEWSQEMVMKHTLMGFRPSAAPEAAGGGSILAQLGASVDDNIRRWEGVGLWYWHSAYTQAKPAASVAWTITEPTAGGRGAPAAGGDPVRMIPESRKRALLATMAVGLGRSLYLASDQTWRLRQVAGDNVHEWLWDQVLRWAVGSDLPAGGKFVRFGASKPVYSQEEAVVITARVLKEDLSPYTGLTFSAVARPMRAASTQGAGAATQGAAGSRTEGGGSVEGRFVESTESPGYYTATLGGLPVGDNEIALKGAEVERLLESDPSVTQKTVLVKVVPQLNRERRNMNTDAGLLARVAAEGGGFSVDACYVDVLLKNLPEIQRTETRTVQMGLFTDPEALGTRIAHWSFLGLFALLITTEWVIRKRAGLV